jgi:tetratricopeptide (TPR) repeat protein
VLAHHYSTALQLAQAREDTDLASTLEAPTLRFLTLAGQRALGLNTNAALADFERALALTPPGHSDRPQALANWGMALVDVGRYAAAVPALEEAVQAMKVSGDLPAATQAMTQLSTALSRLGDLRWTTISAQEVELLNSLPPGQQLVDALASLAVDEALQGRAQVGLRHANHALDLADDLGLPRPARALGYRGVARCLLGDVGGTDDMREAISVATEAGQSEGVAMLHNNLGMALWTIEGPEAALQVLREGIEFAEPRGLTGWVTTISASTLDSLTDLGALDEACDVATSLVEHLQDTGDVFDLLGVRTLLVRVLALRGQADQIASDLAWLESIAREQGSAEDVVIGLGSAALARASLGEDDAAAVLLEEVDATPGARVTQYYPALLPAMVRTAISLGQLELADRFVDGVEARYPYTQHALLAASAAVTEAGGDSSQAATSYADAARRWEQFGVVTERGFALLGQGRCLVAEGQATGAARALKEARKIFSAMDAAPAVARTDAILSGVSR